MQWLRLLWRYLTPSGRRYLKLLERQEITTRLHEDFSQYVGKKVIVRVDVDQKMCTAETGNGSAADLRGTLQEVNIDAVCYLPAANALRHAPTGS